VGDRVFARAVEGKPAQLLGDPDVPHSVTYIEDFARALVTLAEREEALGVASANWAISQPDRTPAVVPPMPTIAGIPTKLLSLTSGSIRLVWHLGGTQRSPRGTRIASVRLVAWFL
jgi:hypothetical protein